MKKISKLIFEMKLDGMFLGHWVLTVHYDDDSLYIHPWKKYYHPSNYEICKALAEAK